METLKKRRFAKEMALPLLALFVWNMAVYTLPRLVTAGAEHSDMSTPADYAIPLIPWTAAIYLGAYLFWAVNYVLACRKGGERAWRFITAEMLSKTICLFFFIFCPTTLSRPQVAGDGFWNGVIRLIYYVDAPDNLFPSIHCLASWFCFIAVRGDRDLPRAYRVFSLVFALAVCVSTLTTKQHVLLDVFAGLALAELCWQLVGISKMHIFVQKLFLRGERP